MRNFRKKVIINGSIYIISICNSFNTTSCLLAFVSLRARGLQTYIHNNRFNNFTNIMISVRSHLRKMFSYVSEAEKNERCLNHQLQKEIDQIHVRGLFNCKPCAARNAKVKENRKKV